MPRDANESALKAFEALCSDVEQFDDAPMPPDAQGLFSERVPLYMKSYLVTWLRNFTRDHGETVRNALASNKGE